MQISFYTPIIFKEPVSTGYKLSIKERLSNFVEHYFILDNVKGVEITKTKNPDNTFSLTAIQTSIIFNKICPLTLSLLKIISYVTLIIPLLMLLAKFILRSFWQFNKLDVISEPSSSKRSSFLIPSRLSKTPSKELPTFPIDEPSRKDSELPLPSVSEILDSGGLPSEITLPSSEDPWVVLTSPPAFIKKELFSKDVNSLNQKKMETLFTSLCIGMSKNQYPDDFKITGTSDTLLFFTIKNYPRIKFITVKNEFFSSLDQQAKGHHHSPELLEKLYDRHLEVKQHMEKEKGSYPHLYLPKCRLFTAFLGNQNRWSFLAVERISFYRTAHYGLVWKSKDEELRAAFEELALLSSKIDLYWINDLHCPPFKSKKHGWSLALTILETKPASLHASDDPQTGIEQLLLSLYSEKSMNSVVKLADTTNKARLENLIERRKKVLSVLHNHEKFHAKHGGRTYNHLTPFHVEDSVIDNLPLNLNEKITLDNNTVVTIKEAFCMLLDYLNILSKRPKWQNALYRHRILFDPISASSKLLGLERAFSPTPNASFSTHSYLRQILNAMVQQKIICSWHVTFDKPVEDWRSTIEIWR